MTPLFWTPLLRPDLTQLQVFRSHPVAQPLCEVLVSTSRIPPVPVVPGRRRYSTAKKGERHPGLEDRGGGEGGISGPVPLNPTPRPLVDRTRDGGFGPLGPGMVLDS